MTPDATPLPQSSPPDSLRRKFRRHVTEAYFAVIALVCILATVQIASQVFAEDSAVVPPGSCEERLGALVDAIQEARAAASEGHDEDEAVRRYRNSVNLGWSTASSVRRSCLAPRLQAALDAIERLRYAEEYAIRREAVDLAPQRRRVRELLAPSSTPQVKPPAYDNVF